MGRPPRTMTSSRPTIPFLRELLGLALRREASAVYVVPWMPPTLRIDERSVPLSSAAFTPEQAALLVRDLLDDAQRAQLDRSREVQFSLDAPDIGRLRVHAFRRHGQPAMAIRPFSTQLPSVQGLALPALACQAVMAEQGLLILASRAPSLRRATATALLEQRNRVGSGDIALLDDATRHWHERARCQVRNGLTPAAVDELLSRRGPRAVAARADDAGPLAVSWGELRDGARLQQAVRIAERALCVVTLEAASLESALLRLLSLADEIGPELRRRLALALHMVLLMRPVPALDDGRELAATDMLGNSPELAATLTEGDRSALLALLTGPASAGLAAMPLLNRAGPDEHLWQLVAQGLVDGDVAARHADDRDAFLARRARPPAEADAALTPVRVDTAFADLFDDDAPAHDPFDIRPGQAQPATSDTQFDSFGWADAAGRPADTGAAALAAPAPSAASVQFHAWAPSAVAPGSLVAVDIWAGLGEQADTIVTQARRAGARPPAAAAVVDGVPVVSVQLRVDGLLESAPAQRLAWQGRPDRVRFTLSVPAAQPDGAHAARVRLSVGGLPVGELGFVLRVSADAAPAAPLEDTHAAGRMLHSAYAAYAPSDLERVRACVAELQRVAPALEVFTDAQTLRHGEQWRERIEREVLRRERLFLFWSVAAAESPWVDFEWRLLMRRRGAQGIDAVLLDSPRLAPLPAELADVTSLELRLRERRSFGVPTVPP